MYLKQTQNKFSSQMIQPYLNLFHSKWKKIVATRFQRLNFVVATPLRTHNIQIRKVHLMSNRHLVFFLYHQLRSKINLKQWTLNSPKKDQART